MARKSRSVDEDRRRSDLAELGLKLGLVVMVLVLAGVALAQTAPPAVVALTPAEMKGQSRGGLAAPGERQYVSPEVTPHPPRRPGASP